MRLLVLLGCALGCLLAFGESVKDPWLRAELLAREQADQQARLAVETFLARHGRALEKKGTRISSADLPPEVQEDFSRLVLKMAETDKANREWLATVLDRYGWPGRTLVGAAAANSAWLLAQHADANRAFQRRCLDLMRAMPAGEVDPKTVAALQRRYEQGVKESSRRP